MPRVDEAQVNDIIETTLTVAQITPFLTTANLLVTARLTGAYDDATLAEIEKYLAAHFLCVRDPRKKSESIGPADVTWFATSTVGEGLASSPHGQIVQQLDYKGLISKTKGSADIEAFG